MVRVGHVELQRAVWVFGLGYSPTFASRVACAPRARSGGLTKESDARLFPPQQSLVAVGALFLGWKSLFPSKSCAQNLHLKTWSRLEVVVQAARATERHSPTLLVFRFAQSKIAGDLHSCSSSTSDRAAGRPARAIDTVRNLSKLSARIAAEIKLDCRESKQMPIPSRKHGETLRARDTESRNTKTNKTSQGQDEPRTKRKPDTYT